MKTYDEFKNPILNKIASGGQQDRDTDRKKVANTSSDNLQSQALNIRKKGASSQAAEIAKRQQAQRDINRRKREGGVGR